jgi:Transposase DDE domain group 1
VQGTDLVISRLRKAKSGGRFRGGCLSSDGGGLILHELERRNGLLPDLTSCFVDYRDQRYIEHGVQELLSQRI